MIEQAFYDVLTAQASITALVANRIYPLLVPENSPLPALTYQFVGGTASSTFTTRGTNRLRVQIDCWGDTYSDVVTLRATVITALDGYLDTTMSIQLIQPIDFYDHELLQYRAMVEMYLYFTL